MPDQPTINAFPADEPSSPIIPPELRKLVLRDFVAHSPAGILMLDHHLRHIEVSPRWTADWGLPRSAIGKCHYEIFPNLPDHIKEAHRRGLAGEVVRNPQDHFVVNGAEVRASWEVRPWGNAAREAGGIIIFAEDLSRMESSTAQRRRHKNRTAPEQNPVLSARARSMVHGARLALQSLLSRYVEAACTCESGYYEQHRAHQIECLAHATVPLITHAERGVRELFVLEELLAKTKTKTWPPEN